MSRGQLDTTRDGIRDAIRDNLMLIGSCSQETIKKRLIIES